ncbi:MAG: hypothetical protein JSV03_00925, partial [Planctomycetota bacterium]
MRRWRIDSHLIVIMLIIAGLLSAGGCNFVPGEKFQATQRELQLTQEKARGLETKIADQEETIGTLQARIAELREMDVSDLDKLIVPVRIELEGLSGGYDDDGKAGDDGIVLYVQPIDCDQHVIKAAGSLKVTLYDLANPPDENQIAEYSFNVPTTRSFWYGRMWTHHFTVR